MILSSLMVRRVQIDGNYINYRLTRRAWSRGVSLRVHYTGELRVSAPKLIPISFIESFLKKQSDWIQSALQKVAKHNSTHPKKTYSGTELLTLKKQTLEKIMPRLFHYGHLLDVTWKNVSIKKLKSRWGSCASTGNLSFSCFLALVSDDLIDYVVVHELAHRKEFNHSPKFWSVVASVFPNYKQARADLRRTGKTIH